MLKKNNQEGFTLAELLIVIAIIAALVAIMIPTFSGQIEKAREATDAANIRAKYAEITNTYMSADSPTFPITDTVNKTQKNTTWDNGAPEINGSAVVAPGSNGWTLTIADTTGTVAITAR